MNLHNEAMLEVLAFVTQQSTDEVLTSSFKALVATMDEGDRRQEHVATARPSWL